MKQRTRELLDTQDATIVILASLVEARDKDTGNHIRRTQHYVRALARQLQTHPLFSDYLSDHQIDILFKSAPLHDIGKVIPDSILLKSGRLDPDEFEIMKTHTTLGHKAIEDVSRPWDESRVPGLRQGNCPDTSREVEWQRLFEKAGG